MSCPLSRHPAALPPQFALHIQVLAEIGVNLDSQMVAAPGGRVAQAAAAPAEAVPQAMGAAVGGGGGGGGGGGAAGGGGGGGDSGLDDDLQARLDRLRKT